MSKSRKIHVLVAPNSMKGSLNAFEFAAVTEEAFLQVSSRFVIRKVPVADGGDYTGEVLRRALQAKPVRLEVPDPLGRPVKAGYGVAGKTAIIEMADASGIRLLKKGEADPMEASSCGTGRLISHAIHQGCTEIILGAGGSATIDGGTGMLSALGFQLLNGRGQPLEGNGKNLQRIEAIIPPKVPHPVKVKIISDVNNPLLGQAGAVAVFGPQKGADAGNSAALENGLARWCRLLERESGKTLASLKGAGAAGGVALPLVAFYDAEIVPGAEYVLSMLDLEKHVRWSDIVITGEGKIDRQTLHDKAPFAVAGMAEKAGKPVIAIGGSVEQEASEAFNGMFSFIEKPLELEESIKNAREMLFHFSVQLARLIDAVSE